jgi:hypothetical protein
MDSETPSHDSNTPATDYSEHWRRYRRLRNVLLVLWIGFIPGLAALTVASQAFGGATLWTVVALVWILATGRVGSVMTTLECPRCGQRFSEGFWLNQPFLTKKCVHCGLPKYARNAHGADAIE